MKEPIYISSRSNQYVIKVHSLSEKKYRDSERLFCADGFKLFLEACACGVEFDSVIIREAEAEKYMPEVEARCPDVRVYLLSDGAFSKISDEKAPQGIISVIKYIDSVRKCATINEALDFTGAIPALALESLRDPGNLGTVIRTAAAFGTELLILSDDCADVYNPRTVRAAMGALFNVKVIRVHDMPAVIGGLRSAGRRVYATALSDTSVSLQDMTLKPDDIFVIGNEGHGLSPAVQAACTGSVFINMKTGPGIESLNAAVAASVIMYERTRYNWQK